MINIIQTYSTGETIKVENISIIENTYRMKTFKTLLINNKIKLIQRDRVGFICKTCSNYFIEKFAFNMKFFSDNYNCKMCDVALTKIEKYGSANAVSQIKKSIKERYGVENISQLDFVKEKKEETFIKNYGVKNNFARKEIRDSMYDSGGKYLNNREKSNETVKERYGVENISQLDFVKEKKEETCFKNHGVKSPMKSNIIRQKFKTTCISKYSVEHISQDKNIHNRQMKSIRGKFNIKEVNENLHYQTKPELDCIEYCQENNISIWDGPIIEYTLNNKKHFYFIDFETQNYVIEIKSDHIWYQEDIKSGKLDAKNNAAKEYAALCGKEFLFLLDIKDYSGYIREKNNVD